jgi:hypothetical protein
VKNYILTEQQRDDFIKFLGEFKHNQVDGAIAFLKNLKEAEPAINISENETAQSA